MSSVIYHYNQRIALCIVVFPFFCLIGGKKMHTKSWLGNRKGTDPSQDLDIDGKILEWILGK